MKKIVSLMVASVFLFSVAQAVFAEEPVVKMLDRHANWTASQTSSKEGGNSTGKEGSANTISFEDRSSSGMGARPGWDHFLEETKTYDYAEDHDNSA